MARHPRLIYPDVALHVVQRGNNRQDCFLNDNDRLVYLAILRDVAHLRQCLIHVYCLMTNHAHMLITPPSAIACSLMMRDLLRCYAAYFNRKYRRTGSLWERPFRSCLVESSAHVLNCYRYIELNPVRAGMAPSPGAYRWSSYAGNARERVDALLTPHVEYVALGEHEERKGQAYRSLMATSDDPAFLRAIRETTEAGYPLVGEALKRKLEADGIRLEAGRPGRRSQSDDLDDDLGGRQLDLLSG